jgi:hypothetical protein
MFVLLQNGIQQEIRSLIEAIGKDKDLFFERNFVIRSEALDDIEFQVIDRIQFLIESTDSSDELNDLKEQAEKLRIQLQEVNTKMFGKLRPQISLGGYRGNSFISLMNEYLEHQPEQVSLYGHGYDHLDLFLNGLFSNQDLPVETNEREAGMVYYQKTPAGIIFELIKKASFKPDDVFYDLGSGLGQAVILVNLLTSVDSRGVEFETAYCNYAKNCAAALNLNRVEFINADARQADYSSGTVFYMYTPFDGEILKVVLQNLQDESKKRRIRLFTYGSCTDEVERQPWLRQTNKIQNCLTELAEFVSF